MPTTSASGASVDPTRSESAADNTSPAARLDSASTGQDAAAGGRTWTTHFPGHVRPPRTVPREIGSGAAVERVWLWAASLRPGGPLIAVSSADGGVGRSTLVAALGGVLALAGPQPLIAVDCTGRAWGGLAHRIGRRRAGSVWDAVQSVDSLTSRSAVERWVQHGPTGLRALVGEAQMTTGRRPPSGAESARLVGALRPLYPLVLLDLPPAEVRWIWLALAEAAAPVLVARATTDSLRHTMRLVAQLRAVGLDAIADAAVVVVMAASPRIPREVRAVARQTATSVGGLIHIPYDAGLAQPQPVDVRRLRRPTRRALLDVADAVLTRCPADPDLAATIVDPPGAADGGTTTEEESC